MRWLFCIFFLTPFVAQSQLSEGFTDGNFTLLPVWGGNSDKFIVNTSKQLQLNSSGADTSYLSTPSTIVDSTEWNFWVKLAFAPSDNNYVKIYLIADQTNLKIPLNGYFIRMGENGSFDSVDLWEQSGTTETKIIDGANGHCGKSTNTLRIKVTRDKSGDWKLYADTLGGINYIPEGNVTDTKHIITSAFGLSCKYTTSNTTKFYFDDVYVGPIRIDAEPPIISNACAVSVTQLDVYFNESVEPVSAEAIAHYSVGDGIGNPVSIQRDAVNPNLTHLVFTNPFQASKQYTLTVNGVSDIAGNSTVSISAVFILPEKPFASDIVINEILPDPNAGGVDFVELYNKSNKVIDLATLTLCSFDTIANQLNSIHAISPLRTLFYPQQYIVLSTNSSAVKNQYYSSNPSGFVEISGFPTMNIASGIIVLADTSKNVIDRFDYKQDMHFALLNTTKGVSLERIDPSHTTNDRNNWHSAGASEGYATPAYKNSQTIDLKAGKEITFSSEIFSPDNDGNNDVLSINYAFETPGYVANVSVYSSNGILVRNLVSNELLSSSGFYTWDGIDNSHELCGIGMYIIHFQLFNSSGTVKNYKKVTVLAHKN
jgi:hypothetical protein